MTKDSNPFIAGLRAYFALNPEIRPATVSDRAGMNKSAIRKMLAGEVGSPRQDNAERIASALGLTVERIITQDFGKDPAPDNWIAVVGQVGAGAEVDLCDAYPKGQGMYRVARPPQVKPGGIVAVEVSGDSMVPVYQPGTVLFYSRSAIGVPTEALGRICVCEDSEGRAWVKQVKTGQNEGTFSLISINPTSETLHGITLAWAAPVRFSLPPEYVERVEG